ncbi:unnamed protein product [Rotaria sp. Silwood1]|nr:unnamed protein product [Rotaria sp. Silwood1]CAF0741143.1 unnamed protein product [Rotaria sp. Silwood1]CAF0796474.1 unnamed protein product [Rotaria sp. Silwood1]CAF3333701.1 unnamed protein product [Rotaria sp. Silwood1]CAF3354038.1 unnamed protein product [Rotaria sp. Silwood1]
MSNEKHVVGDNEVATSKTKKTDEEDETQSRASESDNDDTDSNASSEYEVEKILAKRRRRRGGYEYYIKWVGYDDSANEWIPESSLNCPQRLAEFHREEARKRKRTRRERSYSQKRRSNKSRSKKRRVKVIEDDDNDNNNDNDDDNDEQEPTKSVESSTGSTTISDKDQETKSITYGVEKGYQVQAILGINRTKGEQLHYLVHYKSPTMFDDNMELIPANIAKKYCEDELIQFYETRITWNDRPNDL